MKRIALLLMPVLIAHSAIAADPIGVDLLPSANGDVLVSNVYPCHAARPVFVTLNTNANYSAFCQVFYYDPQNKIPESEEECARNDKLVNDLLELHMAEFWKINTPAQFVDAYANNEVAKHLQDFPTYMKDIAMLVDLPEATRFVVKGVSMQAVGELATLIPEQP